MGKAALSSLRAAVALWLFGCGFLPSAASALREGDLSLLHKLLEDRRFFAKGEFPASGSASLSYAKFGQGRGRHGSLIFVSGKGENLAKYIELFYDLNLQGWSPIYTYDHRGQGFSAYVPPDSGGKGDSLYGAYRKDFEAFIQFVLKQDEADRDRLFLIAHSMGGSIVLDYLQAAGGRQPFQAAALSAPMIRIDSAALSLLEGTFKGYCSLFPCSWNIPSLRSRLTGKTLTDSKIRYEFSERLVEKKFPQAASRGTSLRWIIESFKITERLMAPDRIQRISLPIAILQSEGEQFVSNEHQDLFCALIPHCCHIQKIKGKHEFFMETDGPRDQAIGEMTKFFLDSGKHQTKCRSLKFAEKFFAPYFFAADPKK